MALALINKPIGHKLTGTELEANIYDDGTGTAIVYTGTSHGLSDGDYVYIQSDFDSYNGFKYVDSISYDYFKIKTSQNGDYVEYVQDAAIEYQVSILEHGFIAVHQPIVYEIESSIFPTNTEEESYTPNTVDSFSDADGYTQLELDQSLTDPTELSKIELVGSGELAGVYQIITVLQPWSVVIDLAYDATNDFSGYIIVKYYDNYAINVNVYAGLSTDHRWTTLKPYELAATLKFIPDNDNKTKFSISEILRSYINNRNNLTLDTLPNNLDFIVGFYIEYFETYDVSDGEDITTFTGDVTTDDFVGYALNAKLEFKTESVSHLSEYVNSDTYYSNWLTLFDRPLALVGKFFDISFINTVNVSDLKVTVYKSLEGSVTETEEINITNPGIGIIRVPLTISSGFDEYCVQAESLPYESGLATLSPLTDAINIDGPGPDWTPGAIPEAPLITSGDYLAIPITDITDMETYGFSYEFETDAYSSPRTDAVVISAFISSDPITGSPPATMINFNTVEGGGLISGEASVFFNAAEAGGGPYYLMLKLYSVNLLTGSGDITTLHLNTMDAEVVITPGENITEQICIDIIEECESTYIPEDARLLEDGSFRLLE